MDVPTFPLSIDENFIDTTNGSEYIDENYMGESEIIDENYIDHPNGSGIFNLTNFFLNFLFHKFFKIFNFTILFIFSEIIDENFIDVDESEIFKHCCNFCGKSFVNNGTLRHHIKTVSIFLLLFLPL